jgi:hypothetical protein
MLVPHTAIVSLRVKRSDPPPPPPSGETGSSHEHAAE